MSTPAAFVTGWICCGLFVLAGLLLRRRPEHAVSEWMDAQDSAQFAQACERFTAAAPLEHGE